MESQILVDSGLKVDTAAGSGTPLHTAARKGSLDALSALLKARGPLLPLLMKSVSCCCS
jgi:hypothetical protein